MPESRLLNIPLLVFGYRNCAAVNIHNNLNISFGGKHAALVTNTGQGEVFCWGHEKGGRLGHKVNMDVFHPKIVETLHGVNKESVACGEHHACALTNAGELYTWAVNCVGGDILDNMGTIFRNRNKWWQHKIFGPLDGIYVSSVTCGEWHTAIISSSDQLFAYGEGTFGVLGHGNILSVSKPKELESLKGLRVKSVACGSWHTTTVVDIMFDAPKPNALAGKLFTWGYGDKGKLGHLDCTKMCLSPTCVARFMHYDFVQVSCGRMLTVGLMNSRKVCTMGAASYGKLGNPQAKNNSITIVEGKLKGEFVKGISSGSYHIAVLTSRGEVFTWGKGANGRLGLGDTEDRNSPTPVEALRQRQVESVICGSNFTAAICQHKSIFSTHQSSCSLCSMVFGFTRNKHNCYNCGLAYCNACRNKTVINASLAPIKNKLHRVCNSCYSKLTKSVNSERLIHREKDRRQSTSTNASSHKVSGDEETKLIQEQGTRKQRWINQQLLQPELPVSNELPRWGHVSCPTFFRTYNNHRSPTYSNLYSAILMKPN
ncbi:PH, RCC1 and FYVE domains-containing protein 1-like [Papaver somniferum]|uniref:PH, RCC1 and FYVE domains-containing protein 1-like n=1 Tax=Papaver somniferum TaxID=3469 RepID=UPI000E6FE3C7|nr:PH, RCC1 and FYVE domains-containing protein 1-like [Papaver somniferum]